MKTDLRLEPREIPLLTDLYELTMAASYFDLAAAAAHTLCVNRAQAAAAIASFPSDRLRLKRTASDSLTWVDGLAEAFTHCYNASCLPGETGRYPWATRAHPVDGEG